MTRSRAVAAAAGLLVISQLVVLAGQFAYGAVTGRLVPAAGFGAYVVAMGLPGLLSLVLTSGLPSFALKERVLDEGHRATLWALAWAAGLMASLVVLLAAGLWSRLWGQPEAESVTRWFALNALVSPAVAVQLALVRRQGHARRDAVTLVVAGLVGYALGAVAVARFASANALVVAPTVTTLVGLLIALPVVRPWPSRRPADWRPVWRFASAMSGLGLSAFGLNNVPVWLVSTLTTADALGQFSRGVFLGASMLGLIATSVTRAAFPHYRHVADDGWDAAVLTMARTTAAVALVAAAVTSAVAAPLFRVWLGPAWDLAGALAPLLLIGFAGQSVVVVLMTMAESRSWVGSLSRTHLVWWVVLLLVAAPIVWTRDLWWVAAAVAVSPFAGVAFLVVRGMRLSPGGLAAVGGALVWAGVLAAVVGLSALAGRLLVGSWFGVGAVGELAVGLAAGGAALAVALAVSPTLRSVVVLLVGRRAAWLTAR